MNPHRVSSLFFAAALTLALALAIATGRVVSRGEELAVREAENNIAHAADVAVSLLNRHLAQVDGRLASLGELMAARFITLDEPDRASRILREMTAHSYTFSNLMLADADGVILASARTDHSGGSLPITGAALREVQVPGRAAILGPFADQSGSAQSLYVVREVSAQGAAVPIIAVAKVPTEMIASVLAPMVSPASLRVRLEHADGRVLAAGPGQTVMVGQTITSRHWDITRELRVGRHVDLREGGRGFAAARGLQYLHLFAVVVLPDSPALGGWPVLRTRIIVGAAAFIALLLALAGSVFASQRMRQRAAVEREAANDRLAEAVEGLPDGFVLWDADDRLVMCNTRYRDFFGAARSRVVPGVGFEDLARDWVGQNGVVQGDASVEALVARAVQSHRNPAAQWEREMRDGRWLRIAQQRVGSGGLVVVLSDITTLKRAVAGLGEARDAADRETAAKSRLLVHVSHELRTPLAGLLRLAERLANEANLSLAQRRQVVLVGATGRHLLALANEVLDLAAMEAQSLALNTTPTEPQALLTDALGMVQPLAEAKDIEVIFQTRDVPPLLELDATRVRQMLLNLLANAVKFTPAGTRVRLDARAIGGLLRFEVIDQGPGVPPEKRDSIFTDFTRIDPSAAEGTGLGLSITARLTSLMGGRIGCDDAPDGPGARFWIELPLVRAATPPAPPVQESRRLRLLAVDDAPSNLSVLRALLATTGFELETVTEGAAALEAVEIAAREGRPFDAVLMDVMMPGMDGLETTRRLRALPGTLGAMPVIAVTASAFPEDIAACRAAGMAGHVSKPVDRAVLLRMLASTVAPGATADGGPNDLSALRPLFLAELTSRMRQLERATNEGKPVLGAVHAVAGTVGHLGEPDLVLAARAALKALRDNKPEAAELVAALLAALREAFPEVLPRRAA